MKKIPTLLVFIAIALMTSCTSHSYMLTDRDLTNDGFEIVNQPAGSNFRMVANKPVAAPANADAKWVAASNPHIVAASARKKPVDAIALSAATTVEGHEIMKREIEKAMKQNKPVATPATSKERGRKLKKTAKSEGSLIL